MADGRPRRHDRVWLAPGWAAALAAPAAPPLRAAVSAWIGARRPLVATRGDPARPQAVHLGLALAPGAAGRVALAVDPGVIVRVAPPLALRAVLPSAPAAWRARLGGLDAAARAVGLVLRVHGALAWQHLSGAPHLTPASDVDLLARPRDAAALRLLLALLAAADAGGGPRLDGEVLLPGDRGVSWRELAAGPARLLVRSTAGAALIDRAAALGGLAAAARGPSPRGEAEGDGTRSVR